MNEIVIPIPHDQKCRKCGKTLHIENVKVAKIKEAGFRIKSDVVCECGEHHVYGGIGDAKKSFF